MDCCEDVCEHAICCNCASVIYDVWDESLQAGNNNQHVVVNSNKNDIESDEFNGDNEVVNGFFHNACEDCCEDICEHAICCNCTASIVSHWFEAVDVDNGNEIEPVTNEDKMMQLQNKAFRHIKRAKKICCTITCILLLILIITAVLLFYFLYYKPKYQ